MKVEDAALQLEQIYGFVSEEIKRALDVADDALSKQIAEKPAKDENGCPCLCPICDADVFIPSNYCENCGQKLKWEEEE